MVGDSQDALRPLGPDVVAALVENHRRFLSFLERRVGNHAPAEEILQSAYGRAVEKGVPADESEGAVHWFFAVLRNAVTDHYRRRATESRTIASLVNASITGASRRPRHRRGEDGRNSGVNGAVSYRYHNRFVDIHRSR